MKKPESEIRSAPLHAKIRPRFKKMAEKMASEDDRSLAQWLELMIQASKSAGRRNPDNKSPMAIISKITPALCRAARGLLDMTQIELAAGASVSKNTIVDFEKSRALR